MPALPLLLAWVDVTPESVIGALDVAARAGLIVLLAWLVTLVWRRSTAAMRHLVWISALTAALAVPVVRGWVPTWAIPLLPAPTRLNDGAPVETRTPAAADMMVQDARAGYTIGADNPERFDAFPQSTGAAHSAAPAPSGGEFAVGSATGRDEWPRRVAARVYSILGWVWIIGAFMVLARLAAAQFVMARRVRRSRPLADARWSALLRDVVSRIGVATRVELRESPGLAVPAVCGIIRPVVVVPPEASGWPPDRARSVLLHELAHVRRRDCLWQLLAQLACTAHWFNPLIWFAAARARAERERACDDLVLLAGTRPSDYAAHLLEIVRGVQVWSRPSSAAVAMARGGDVGARLRAVLDGNRRRGGTSAMLKVSTCLIAAALLLSAASVQPWADAAASEPAAAPPAPPGDRPAAEADERTRVLEALIAELRVDFQAARDREAAARTHAEEAMRAAEQARRLAEEALHRAEEAASRVNMEKEHAHAAAELLHKMLAEAHAGHPERARLVEELLHKAADEARKRPDDPEIRARILSALAHAQLQVGRTSDADKYLEAALEAYRQTHGDRDPRAAAILEQLARLREERGESRQADELYRRALDAWRPAEEDEKAVREKLMAEYGALLGRQGRLTEAERLTREALTGDLERLGRTDPQTIAVMNQLALLLRQRGDVAEAERLLREAIELSAHRLGKSAPETRGHVEQLAELLRDMGRAEEAEALRKHIQELSRHADPKHDPRPHGSSGRSRGESEPEKPAGR